MSTLMPYVLLVSCVFAAAALLAERALGALGRPARGVWLAALAASIAVPILASAIDGGQVEPSVAGVSASRGGDVLGEVAAATLEKRAPAAVEPGFVWEDWTEWARWSGWQSLVDGASWSSSQALDDGLLALWIAVSVLVLLAHGAAWVALRRMLRRLPRARIDGTEVAVSDRLGPAVFGLLERTIIVPRWLLDAPERMQHAVVLHERAHVAARDTSWLAAAMLAVALAPWNPLMWWQLKRLRAAVEIDCDARVVRGGARPLVYARVLLAVAERQAAFGRPLPMLGAVASTGPASQLERRVRRLLLASPRPKPILAALCGASAALAFAAAFALDPPEPVATAGEVVEPRAIERERMTGIAIGGERVVLLVDVSASMLDRTAAGVEQRLAEAPEERLLAPKWLHLVETVERLAYRIPSGASFQVILFDEEARAALPGTDGQWLTATRSNVQRSVDALREDIVAEGQSDLRAAFEAANALQPPPDLVHLVVDGLPASDEPSDEEARLDRFTAATASVPADAPINVILMPKEGEAVAASAYWTLAHRTGGALFAPVEGAMQSAVPGVPLDAEYLIFIVDTSGSMRMYAADNVEQQIRETLDAHPVVKGIQVMNDMGEYLFDTYAGDWMPDTPAVRQSIMESLRGWSAFSRSSPREGIVRAIETYYDPSKRISVFVFGDDLAREPMQEALDGIEQVNRDAATGAIKMRIHSVAMPTYLDVTGELLSAAGYVFVMRELTLRHGGAFIALPRSPAAAAGE